MTDARTEASPPDHHQMATLLFWLAAKLPKFQSEEITQHTTTQLFNYATWLRSQLSRREPQVRYSVQGQLGYRDTEVGVWSEFSTAATLEEARRDAEEADPQWRHVRIVEEEVSVRRILTLPSQNEEDR